MLLRKVSLKIVTSHFIVRVSRNQFLKIRQILRKKTIFVQEHEYVIFEKKKNLNQLEPVIFVLSACWFLVIMWDTPKVAFGWPNRCSNMTSIYILGVSDSQSIWMFERTMDTLIKIFQICLFCWKAMM